MPVFINHVGRHGSRYPASDTFCMTLRQALQHARSLGTLTPLGCMLDSLNNEIITQSSGQWGALDSLGKAEQAGIARRMILNYPEVFSGNSEVVALSSHSPRSIASMEAFITAITSINPDVRYSLSSGKEYNPTMRPFDIDKSYLEFRASKQWEAPYITYFNSTAPTEPIQRVLGDKYKFMNDAEARDLSLIEYYVLAGCQAMSLENPMSRFFTPYESNALWSCFNLRQYLQRSATSISSIPADIASSLVRDLIDTTDAFIAGKQPDKKVILRFGHGETIIPLVSLLRLPGCYYITDDFNTVSSRWHDFSIIPMAANVQIILYRSLKSGQYYAQILLNEHPVRLNPDDATDLYPWETLREYFMSCISSCPGHHSD